MADGIVTQPGVELLEAAEARLRRFQPPRRRLSRTFFSTMPSSRPEATSASIKSRSLAAHVTANVRYRRQRPSDGQT